MNPLAQAHQEYREGFVRQRRNLIIISLSLLFAETSKLTLTRLSVFGNELVIANPVVVNYALWTAWTYWLLRYYQYLRHVGGISQIRDAYRERLDNTVRSLVRQKALKSCRSPDGFYLQDISTRSLSQWRIEHGERIPLEGPPRTSREERRTTILTFGGLLLPRIYTWAFVIFSTRLATEYVLPFVIALLPFGNMIYQSA